MRSFDPTRVGEVRSLHVYRDKARSAHFELVGDGEHPWTIDLVVVTTVVGVVGALRIHLV